MAAMKRKTQVGPERAKMSAVRGTPSTGAGEFEHLLGSLAGLELEGLTRRSDADEQRTASLAEVISVEAVRHR